MQMMAKRQQRRWQRRHGQSLTIAIAATAFKVNLICDFLLDFIYSLANGVSCAMPNDPNVQNCARRQHI